MITKEDRYKYLRNVDATIVARQNRELSSFQRGVIGDKLLRWKEMYDRLDDQRRIWERCIDFTNGKQWNDFVEIEKGKWVSEEKHILEQGKIPLKNNMIEVLVNSIVGVFRANKTQPEVRARKRDQQALSDMLSCALQYAHQTNDLMELDAITFREYLMTAIACHKVDYRWVASKNIYDVYVSKVSPFRLFFNGDTDDVRGYDITTIGEVEDWDLDELVAQFARTPEEKDRLLEIYKNGNRGYYSYDALDKRRFTDSSFTTPSDSNKCRVIQVWEKESKERLRVHDKFNGEYYILDVSKEQQIIDENRRRWEDAQSNGITREIFEQQIEITYKWHTDRFWMCYYVSPYGDIIFQKETPYWHKETPFTLKLYPLINGEVHSFVENIIDQQKYINRLITLIDFIIGASAKGVLIFPEDALGDMSKEEVLDEWTSYNGVIFAKVKAGMPMPQQISSNATNVGATELLTLQLRLLTEISGVSGAMQGQTAKSGVSASLYNMETQNSQNNILDLIESFESFRRMRDYKMMKVMQQYYDEERYSNIAGKQYSEEARWYNPDKCRKCEFDMVIAETQLTPTYRAMMNQFLLSIFQMGKMSVKTLLKASTYPFSDQILKAVDEEEQQMIAAQAGMAAQQQVSPMGGTPANDLGSQQAVEKQLAQMANPQTMQLLQQAMA